jgi:hypothetical protein
MPRVGHSTGLRHESNRAPLPHSFGLTMALLRSVVAPYRIERLDAFLATSDDPAHRLVGYDRFTLFT